MKQFKSKPCKLCSTVFTPQAPCNLYCSPECAEKAFRAKEPERREKAYKVWAQEQIRLGRGHVIGVGKGGNNKRFKDNPQFSSGAAEFNRLKKIKKAQRYCERCSKDLEDASPAHWCTHHIDHNPRNNVIENLELLCKRCHLIEHECWKHFDGATTIPKGSTPKQAEAPDTQTG